MATRSAIVTGLMLVSLFMDLGDLYEPGNTDIRGILEGGWIAAFIILGVLLLVISFMYQHIKKLLAADGPEKDRPGWLH